MLSDASRADAKRIRERIFELRQQKSKNQNELNDLEDQIKRKQNQVDKLDEKSFQTGIRTSVLGKDADRHEYWHFKDDAEKIYVRLDFPILSEPDPMTGVSEVLSHKFTWYYIEDEDKYEQLVDSLNPKGIREKSYKKILKRLRIT